MKRLLNIVTLFSFLVNIAAPYNANAQTANPGTLLKTTAAFTPVSIKGLKLYADDPFKFDFILDEGSTKHTDTQLKEEAQKLINYFLVSLTIPQEDLWVNLSPYEQNRVIPEALSATGMGEDMLSQDYLLKQLASSLTYPETESGKQYWKTIASGTDNLQKVWITPDESVIYADGDKAYIGKATLKVACEKNIPAFTQNILPILQNEVNSGNSFAQVRQIYRSLILATWFKKYLKENVINKLYSNKTKTAGVDTADADMKEKIYNAYLQSCKNGIYNIVKDERTLNKIIKRKYFSGGLGFQNVAPVVKPLTLAPREALREGISVMTVLEQLAQDNDEEGNAHGVYINEGGAHWHIHVNHTQIQQYIDDFKAIFGENVTEKQAIRFIDGHETFHALIDHLHEQGYPLSEITSQTEELMANIFGYAFAMHHIKSYGGMEKNLAYISKIIGIDLLTLLNTNPESIEQLLEKLNIFVTVDTTKTPEEIRAIIKEALASGHNVKPMKLGSNAKGLITFATLTGLLAVGVSKLDIASNPDTIEDLQSLPISIPTATAAATTKPNIPTVDLPADAQKSFRASVKSFEIYDDKAADDFLQMVLSWKDTDGRPLLLSWKQTIDTARKGTADKDIIAKAEEGIIKSMIVTVTTHIQGVINQSSLPEITQAQEADCTGYMQIFHIFADYLDIPALGISVMQYNPILPITNNSHVETLFQLTNNTNISTNIATRNPAYTLFTINTRYAKDDNGLRLRSSDPVLHPRIRLLDKNKTTSVIFSNYALFFKQKKDSQHALDAINKAIELDDQNATAYLNRAGIYTEQKKYPEALKDYDKAIALDSRSSRGYLARGILNIISQRFDEALSDANMAIQLRSTPDAYLIRGKLYLQYKNDPDRAILDFNKVLQLYPNSDVAYQLRSVAYRIKNDYPKAIEDINKAIELNPKEIRYYEMQGTLYFYSQDYKHAIASCQQALKLDPSNTIMRLALEEAQSALQQTTRPKVLDGSYQGLTILPNDGSLNNIRILTNRRDLRKYRAAYERVLGKDCTEDQMRRYIDFHETFHVLMQLLRTRDAFADLAAIENGIEEQIADIWGITGANGQAEIPKHLKHYITLLETAINKLLVRQDKEKINNLAEYINNLDPYDTKDCRALEKLIDSIGISVDVYVMTPEEIEAEKKKAEAADLIVKPSRLKNAYGGINYTNELDLQETGRGIDINYKASEQRLDIDSFTGFKARIIQINRP